MCIPYFNQTFLAFYVAISSNGERVDFNWEKKMDKVDSIKLLRKIQSDDAMNGKCVVNDFIAYKRIDIGVNIEIGSFIHCSNIHSCWFLWRTWTDDGDDDDDCTTFTLHTPNISWKTLSVDKKSKEFLVKISGLLPVI